MCVYWLPEDGRAMQHRSFCMQKLNALPFVFIVANCISWLAYSFTTDNWYLFVPNVTGLMIGMLLFLLTFGIGVPDKWERDKITGCVMVLATVLPIVGGLERLVLKSEEAGQKAWGYTGAPVSFAHSPMASCLVCTKLTAPDHLVASAAMFVVPARFSV
jgi:Sugar efflux transporter for intercellular exchange